MVENGGSQEVIKAIAVLQQDIKHMSKQIDTITTISDKTIRIEESAKVAHRRIDETNADIKEIQASMTWTWRTIGAGIIAFIIDKLFL